MRAKIEVCTKTFPLGEGFGAYRFLGPVGNFYGMIALWGEVRYNYIYI